MKKRKTTERKSADFSNKPFKTLKGFGPGTARAVIPSETRTHAAARDEDDAGLFLRAVSGVKKIGASPGPAPDIEKPKAAAQAPQAVQPRDQELFLQAMKKIGASFNEIRETEEAPPETERRSLSSRMRQLKRGTISISEELDLHGFLKNEALVKLGHYISAAYARGRQAVLVITGKGINSPEGPVLQGAVADWLRMAGKGMVAEFHPAPRDKGGSGAYVVFLRKRG